LDAPGGKTYPPMLGKPKELEGVLLVDKPTGFTSHDVVARLRRKLAMKRIGHAGTLDPMATGLLIMLVGKATRISQYLTNLDKEYAGTIELGKTTNSQDADGEVMETRPVPPLTEEQVRAAMQTFLGDQYQTPPMFSAIKVDGVPLYKRARKGEEVEREPRFIRVSSYELTRFAPPQLDFLMHLCAHPRARSWPEARLRRASLRAAPHGHGQIPDRGGAPARRAGKAARGGDREAASARL
jgi:tRNA pseudouridine55 synthase